MAKLSAIILAAGLSRRMGKENKLLLPVKGKPMVEWVIGAVNKSMADEIIIVGSELSMDQLRKWQSDRIQVIENLDYKQGMTSSIQAGVSAATGEGYMICLGDQPEIRTETYNQLITEFQKAIATNKATIMLPFYEGKKGNPVTFSSAYRAQILDHAEPEGCKQIIHDHPDAVVKVATSDPGILMDIDTRDQYNQII